MGINRPGGLDRVGFNHVVGAFPVNGTYSTNFATAESAILEKGIWRTGLREGVDWCNMQVVGGVAYGTQTGTTGPPYDDAVAVLQGVWGVNQTVTATVKTINQNSTGFFEVELWGRADISPHFIRGYECAFRCTHDGSQYIGIVRWDGPLNTFTPLPGGNITGSGLSNGDTISITVSGTSTVTVEAFINGVSQGTRTDSTAQSWQYGAPGFGHWFRLNGAVGPVVSDFGLTSFSAVAP